MTINYFKTGKVLYAIAILAIGIIHFLFKNFPIGLLPVPSATPFREILIFASGGVLVVSAILLLIPKYVTQGAIAASITWVVFLLLVHLPKLFMNINNGSEWTGTFEVTALLAGACMLITSQNMVSFKIGRYLFIIALIVFGIQHYLYAAFVATLIPGWIPAHLFFTYLTMAAFIATAISLLINRFVQVSTCLLGLMFILWVLCLHLPRAIMAPKVEPEWTSLFVALAMCSIALIASGSQTNNYIRHKTANGS